MPIVMRIVMANLATTVFTLLMNLTIPAWHGDAFLYVLFSGCVVVWLATFAGCKLITSL